jgi:excinuclease ABC subunit B
MKGDGAHPSPERGGGTARSAVGGVPSRARKNTLDEMTIRRTEVPLGGKRPRKPTLDEMGRGAVARSASDRSSESIAAPSAPRLSRGAGPKGASDAGVPHPKPAPKKPRVPHKPGSPVGRGKRR